MAKLTDADGVVEGLPFKVETHTFIGSALIFGEGNDVDILLLVNRDLLECHDDLKERGWATPGSEFYSMDEDNWFSARKGVVNLLVTDSQEHYDHMAMGALICYNLNKAGRLPRDDKDMRVIIHRTLTGEDLE